MAASQCVFLIGSFSASPWMYQEVERWIATHGLKLEVSRPEIQTYIGLLLSLLLIYVCTRSKAVADGAVSYYLDHFAISRLMRYVAPTGR